MKDYQESQFQILDYEIQSLSANSESSNITFTGFRYSDGANVVGTITESDEVVIDNVAENGNKIINLISLSWCESASAGQLIALRCAKLCNCTFWLIGSSFSPQTDVEIALGVGLLFFLWKRHALLRIILSYGYDGFTEA